MSTVYTSEITDDEGNKDIIIAYPRENTLHPQSLLKMYATGIAFEIKYYANANAKPQTHTYYHYLRHQGEESTGIYEAKELKPHIINEDNATCGSSPAMNYGVVRNKIYRVSIASFSNVRGHIKLIIEEKHWRHVDNPVIYL